MRYIQGDDFIRMANCHYCSGEDVYLHFNRSITDNLIYTHNHFIKDLLIDVKKYNEEVVIVSQNTDTAIEKMDIPDNVIKIFAQNINFVHTKIESIPIGLENDRWFPHMNKKNKIINKLNESKHIRNLVYMNHNVNTNLQIRMAPFNILHNKNFVTTQMLSNGQNFDNYIDNVYNHKFIICPEGHGIDTHRKWEALYLNSIPIEIKSINNSFYEDLPILLIDSWDQLNEEFLNAEYERIININWNLDKLDFNYWSDRIKKYLKK